MQSLPCMLNNAITYVVKENKQVIKISVLKILLFLDTGTCMGMFQ